MAHILYLHQYYCPEGGFGNNRSAEFAKYWVQSGHRVTVLTSVAQFPKEHPAHQHSVFQYSEHGIEIIVFNIPYQHEFSFLKRIFAWIQFLVNGLLKQKQLPKPDLMYASSTPLTIGELGLQLSSIWKVPFVLECVDVWPDVPVGMNILKNPILIQLIQSRTNLLSIGKKNHCTFIWHEKPD